MAEKPDIYSNGWREVNLLHGQAAGHLVQFYDRINMDTRSDMAWKLLQTWGVMQGITVAKIEEMSHSTASGPAMEPKEMVARAFETVDLFWDEAIRRDWVVNLPPFEEALKEDKQKAGFG